MTRDGAVLALSRGGRFATPVTLTATAITGGTLTDLQHILHPGQSVLCGWDFANITGYTSADTGCRWVNGNLNPANSRYVEGDASVQRCG